MQSLSGLVSQAGPSLTSPKDPYLLRLSGGVLLWTFQGAPPPPFLSRHLRQVTGPARKFTTWELVAHFKEWLRVVQYSRTAQESYTRGVSKFCVYIGRKPL